MKSTAAMAIKTCAMELPISEEKISSFTPNPPRIQLPLILHRLHRRRKKSKSDQDLISNLPTEVLSEILSKLDYYTLNRTVRLVCRHFNSIILDANCGPLGEALFRCKQARLPRDKEDHQLRTLKMHPCITEIRLNRDDIRSRPLEISDIGFRTSRFSHKNVLKKGFIPLCDTYAANECALAPATPAVSFYHINYARNIMIPLVNLKIYEKMVICNGSDIDGITVRQLAEAQLEKLNKEREKCLKYKAGVSKKALGKFSMLLLEDKNCKDYKGKHKHKAENGVECFSLGRWRRKP